MWFLSTALAKSWCAAPLAAHEWGVAVLPADGRAVQKPALPTWFHRRASLGAHGPPVRLQPADGGERSLPILHFRSLPNRETSIGLEVGFTHGDATVWFPGTNQVTPAELANSPAAAASREALVRRRAELKPRGARADLGDDPTKQLHWGRLDLRAAGTPRATEESWVTQARQLDTLWVQTAGETERFVFYEAEVREQSSVRVVPVSDGVRLENTSDWDVHDVWMFDGDRVAGSQRIPAGTSATVAWGKRTDLKSKLQTAWTRGPLVQTGYGDGECVMMEDPQKPVEQAIGHQLFADEVELVWDVWGTRMMGRDRHLIYREDPAALDAAMPLSIYSDMRHFVQLSRLGIVLVEGL